MTRRDCEEIRDARVARFAVAGALTLSAAFGAALTWLAGRG